MTYLGSPPKCKQVLSFKNEQLFDEAEYSLMNYGDRGVCYIPRPINTLRDLHSRPLQKYHNILYCSLFVTPTF